MPTAIVNHDLPLAERMTGRRDDLTVIATSDREETLSKLADAEVLVSNQSGLDDQFLDRLDPGDWIQSTSAGYDAAPIDALRDRDVRFSNAAGIHDSVVAEHAFALALAFSRLIPQFTRKQDASVWGPRTEMSLALSDWRDRTLTIYGLGNIGDAIADRGLAFGMEVYGIKRDPDAYDGRLPDERVLAPEAFDDVLPDTDLLVASVPLTEKTRGSIDAEAFEALPDSAHFVNVSRGAVVDEGALVEALRMGEIAGAGLDVFEKEPLPEDSPLWDREDVIVTPHVGGRSNNFPERFAMLFLENYDRWRAGEELENQIL